jgi:hypothetical protein
MTTWTKRDILLALHEASDLITKSRDENSAELLQDAFEKAYADLGGTEHTEFEKQTMLELHDGVVEIAKAADPNADEMLKSIFENAFAKLGGDAVSEVSDFDKSGVENEIIAKAQAEPPIVGETKWRYMRRICKNDAGVRALDEVTKSALGATYDAHMHRINGPVLAADALTSAAQAIQKSALDRGEAITFEKAYSLACQRRPDLYLFMREQQAVVATPVEKSAVEHNAEIAKADAEAELNRIAKGMEGQTGANGKPMSFFQAFAKAAAAFPEVYKASRGLTQQAASATGGGGHDALVDPKDDDAPDADDGQLLANDDNYTGNVNTHNIGSRDGQRRNARTAGDTAGMLRKSQIANDELLRLAGTIRKSRPGMTATSALAEAYRQRSDLYEIAKGRA